VGVWLITRALAQARIVRVREIAETDAGAAWAVVADNGVQRGSGVKKYVRKMRKKIKPLYAGVAVLLLVVVVLVIVLAGGGGDDNNANTTAPATTATKEKAAKKPKKRTKPVKQAPIGTTGVIDEARRNGDFVVAQARATVKAPSRISLRLSAAPKQTVTVDWQLSCFKNRQVKVGKGKYHVKSPDERAISLPIQGAENCIATAGAQLTRHGGGRVKIAIVGG
jgi:hypothetical protein